MIAEFVPIILVAIGVLLVLGLAIFIVVSKLYKELKRKNDESVSLIMEAQELERVAISREVHDNLGPTLSITQMQIGYLIEVANEEIVRDMLVNVQKQMHQSISLCRDISHMISPEIKNEKDLRIALEEQISTINKIGKIEVQLNFHADKINWDPAKGTSLVRVIQELIANSIKHANATKVMIEITQKESFFQLIYSDNGQGFIMQNVILGLGIKNISKRIDLLSGKINWKNSKITNGMNATILIPITNLSIQ